MKKLILASIGLAALFFGACSREQLLGGDGNKLPANTLRVSLAIQGIGTELATRATVAPETGEDQVNTLYLLFFVSDPYKNGQFIDYVTIDGPFVMNTPININLSGHPLLSVTAAYNVLALANISDTEPHYTGDVSVDMWISQWQNHTENYVMSQAVAWAHGSNIDDSNAIAANKLLMSGRVVKAENQYDLNITMVRNLARFDVNNNVSDTYDLVSTSIWNAYPQSSIWGGGVMDYTASTSRVGRFYGVSNTANVTGSDLLGDILGNINGSLYSFENQVAAPVQNDRMTTCLIVGLRDRTSGTTTYYRANINPAQSAQVIKRNNVYRLTIRNVNGPGQSSEQLAYTGQGNNLDYVINYWDLDDNGLIVKDGNSILSIPTKMVNIGASGIAASYSIFTFSNTPGMILSIKSQTYDPANGGITASLTGNTLNISATPLALGETQRNGVVVLSYAGLEASISIVQSPSTDTYLNVVLPDGGIPRFAPYAGIASGLITVKASGTWTAKLYMDGFSLGPAPSPSSAITTIASTGGYVTNNQFRIYTYSPNLDPIVHEAFVVVSLDSDPVNYASVIRISQSQAGGIDISPTQTTVTFNGSGTGLANIAGNATNTFNVLPSMEDDGNGGTQISAWEGKIIQSGATDDTGSFTILEQHDPLISANNTITVNAAGMNTSGRSYNAVLRIWLTDVPSKFTDIKLVQQSATVDTSPNSFQAIPTNGGQTPLIAIQADNTLQWSATITTNSGQSADGRSLVQHAATLVDGNGNPIVAGNPYPMTTGFRVVFPKVYYPNRDITISASVNIMVAGITKTITVNQTPLTAKTIYPFSFSTSGYGQISNSGDSYNRALAAAVRTLGSIATGTMAANVNFAYRTNNNLSASEPWTAAIDFLQNHDGLYFLSGDYDDSGAIAAMNNANSPVRGWGVAAAGSRTTQINTAAQSTKIYQLFMGTHTASPLTTNISFPSLGSPTSWATTLPATAVPMIVNTVTTTSAFLAVDPKSRVIYLGDGQLFDGTLATAPAAFLDNMMIYISNVAKYGSNFADLMIESSDPAAKPAPWDPYWGANAGVPSK